MTQEEQDDAWVADVTPPVYPVVPRAMTTVEWDSARNLLAILAQDRNIVRESPTFRALCLAMGEVMYYHARIA
jgi:hypothetical protein